MSETRATYQAGERRPRCCTEIGGEPETCDMCGRTAGLAYIHPEGSTRDGVQLCMECLWRLGGLLDDVTSGRLPQLSMPEKVSMLRDALLLYADRDNWIVPHDEYGDITGPDQWKGPIAGWGPAEDALRDTA